MTLAPGRTHYWTRRTFAADGATPADAPALPTVDVRINGAASSQAASVARRSTGVYDLALSPVVAPGDLIQLVTVAGRPGTSPVVYDRIDEPAIRVDADPPTAAAVAAEVERAAGPLRRLFQAKFNRKSVDAADGRHVLYGDDGVTPILVRHESTSGTTSTLGAAGG